MIWRFGRNGIPKASYLHTVFFHSDQVMFLVLLVPVLLVKASYFWEKKRIHPWYCQVENSFLQIHACMPAISTEERHLERTAEPEGQTRDMPVRCCCSPSASQEIQQHRRLSAGDTSGRPAEPTEPSSTSAQHPAGRKRVEEQHRHTSPWPQSQDH